MNNKFLSRGRVISLIALTVSLSLIGGCSGKKKSPMLWFLGLGGSGLDVNGNKLPNDVSGARQEVATSGPAHIEGSIHAVIDGEPETNICGQPLESDPDNCIDYTKVKVHLVDPDGNDVATTMLDEDGNFSFDIDELDNNNYRVLIETGEGLNSTHQDFPFVFDPTTENGVTDVALGDIDAERLFLDKGPAKISGTVTTPGFNGDVTVPAGGVAGVEVKLYSYDPQTETRNLIETKTTNAQGEYQFDIPELNNGKYIVVAEGSGVQSNSRPFSDAEQGFDFKFKGNDNQVATTVTLQNNIDWQAADKSSIALSGSINNAAIAGDTTTQYAIKLTDSTGATIASTSITGTGAFSLSGSNLKAGVYSVQVVGKNGSDVITFPASMSFSFTPHSAGGSKSVSAGTISLAPLPSDITGRVQSGSLTYVPGSVINFKPSKAQPPVNLLYLLNDDKLRDLVKLWISESVPAVATNCSLTGNLTPTCLMTYQGSGPWNYSTYSNKLYEVKPNGEVYFTAVGGKWDFYLSAPGYQNNCNGEADCVANPMNIALNGQDVSAGTYEMTPSTKRAEIKGSIAVRDQIIADGATNGSLAAATTSSPSDMFVILLGNTNESGQAVAHITTTVAGNYSFNGSSKVVTLPGSLTNDQERAGYAIQAYATATLLSSSSVAGDATKPIHVVDDRYNFKQSSYQVLVVDPLQHITAASFAADLASIATDSYVATAAELNKATTVTHLPRRQIVGNVFNAISTSAVQATIKIGTHNPSGDFVQDVRRDCSGSNSLDSYTCSMPTVRLPGSDQLLDGSLTASVNGSFVINNLDPGNYVLKVSMTGYADTEIPVTVNPTGPTPTISVPLVPNQGTGHLTGSIRLPGGHDFTGTYTLELVHPTSGNRPTGDVQPASLKSGPTSFSNAPTYSIFKINAGQWKVRFMSSGYKTVEGIVNIQKDVTTNFDIITMIPGSDPAASIGGKAINAITNNSSGMSGLTVRIRPGVNVTSGPYATAQDGITVLPAATTASDGSFAINNVPAGNYTLEVSGTNVATAYTTVISAGAATPAQQNILVSPILQNDEVRIVLSWNAKPRDLDSHFEFGSNSRTDQVVWNDRTKLGGDAILDVDVVTGYGPETVTLKNSVWSQSRRGYSVYNWSQDATLKQSGAVIRIYRSNGLVRSYAVSPNQPGVWWQVFCLGTDKSIIDIGQTGCKASDFFNAPYKR